MLRLNYWFIFLYLTLDVPPQPCQKFNDSGCCTGRGLQPPVTLRTEQVVASAGQRDDQVLPPTPHDQTHRAGFRGFNPQRSGGKFSSETAFQVRRRPGGQNRRRGGRSPILSRGRLSRPRASGSGAARRGPGRRGVEGEGVARAPAPPPQAGGRAAPPESLGGETPTRRCPARGRVPCGRPPFPSARAAPAGRGGPGPRRPAPRSAPRPPQPQPNGSVTPAEGRGGGGSVSPTFPEGSARALTSESRRFGAEEGGYPGASSSGTGRSRSASGAEPARGPPRPPARGLLGCLPGCGGAASAPLLAPSPRSSRFLFHPRDRERRRRHAYYGAGRRSPASARPVRLREPRRRRPRRPGPRGPRSFPGARAARGAARSERPLGTPARPPRLQALSRAPAAPASRSLCRGHTRATPGKCVR